jgi:hypothetical protein
MPCSIKGVSLAEGEANDGHGTAAQRALRAVHEHGYLHGDLLSSNVMLFAEPTQASAARLIDLGGSSIAESIEMQRAEELQLAALFAQQVIQAGPTWLEALCMLHCRQPIELPIAQCCRHLLMTR